MDIEQTFARAAQRFQRGAITEAEALFRQLIDKNPRHAEALHYLGVCCYRRGNYEAAVAHILAALAVDDASPFAHSNLGLALKRMQRMEEAVASFGQA